MGVRMKEKRKVDRCNGQVREKNEGRGKVDECLVRTKRRRERKWKKIGEE